MPIPSAPNLPVPTLLITLHAPVGDLPTDTVVALLNAAAAGIPTQHLRYPGPWQVGVQCLNVTDGQQLNKNFRGKDYPTNILSFPTNPADAWDDIEQAYYLGDLAITSAVVAQEAARDGKDIGHHLQHLLVHGVLHLCGYDHETEAEAATMEALEIAILKTLAIPNPYAV